MTKYNIMITETLQLVVEVIAENQTEAEEIVKITGVIVSIFWMLIILLVFNLKLFQKICSGINLLFK